MWGFWGPWGSGLLSSLSYIHNLLHLPFISLEESRSPVKIGKKRVEPNAERTPSLPNPFSRGGASSHVAASLFRYQGRIVRIDCNRAQLFDSLPLSPVTRTSLTRKPPFTDNGFYNLIILSSVGWSWG